MDSKFVPAQFRSAIIAAALVLSSVPLQVRAQAVSLDAAKLPRIGTVDERFASYNIEMAEVTGGNFWKPYHGQSSAAGQATQARAICFDPGRHESEYVSISPAYRSHEPQSA
jgi:hypothetical protein